METIKNGVELPGMTFRYFSAMDQRQLFDSSKLILDLKIEIAKVYIDLVTSSRIQYALGNKVFSWKYGGLGLSAYSTPEQVMPFEEFTEWFCIAHNDILIQ